MIHNLLQSSLRRNIVSDTGVYRIPCKSCKLKYIGEASWNIHKHLNEYRRDIRVGNLNNALLQHISKTDYNFNFNAAMMLIYRHNKD